VGGRAGRPDELRAEPRRGGRDELDRDPVDGDAEGALLVPLDDRHHRRRRGEALERVGGAGDERQLVDELAAAAQLARRHRVGGGGHGVGERGRAVPGQPAPARGGVAREAREDLRLGRRADARRVA
jgi:hypothetical protein